VYSRRFYICVCLAHFAFVGYAMLVYFINTRQEIGWEEYLSCNSFYVELDMQWTQPLVSGLVQCGASSVCVCVCVCVCR